MLGTGAVGMGDGGLAREAEDDEFMGADEELDMDAGVDLDNLEDEEELDLGADDDLGLGDEDLGDEGLDAEGDMQEVSLTTLRRVLDAVERGEMSADEAYDECCGGGADLGADEDLGADDLDLGGDDELMSADEELDLDDDLDLGDEDLGESYNECLESVDRIASMLTEDPDIFTR